MTFVGHYLRVDLKECHCVGWSYDKLFRFDVPMLRKMEQGRTFLVSIVPTTDKRAVKFLQVNLLNNNNTLVDNLVIEQAAS